MRRLVRAEDGGTAVEMALVMPVLVLLLMVLIEGGRVLNVWMIMSNGAREAARYGVAYRQQVDATSTCTWSCEISNYATADLGQMLDTSALQPLTVCTPADSCPTSVQVTATYTINTITPIIQAIKPTITVSAHAQMRVE